MDQAYAQDAGQDAGHDAGILAGRVRILEMVATGQALEDTLAALTAFVEAREPGTRCGILLVAEDGTHFEASAGAGLPHAYHQALGNRRITPPYLGACGEVAHLGVPVDVPDVARDRRYPGSWRDLILSCGLAAVRSRPVRGSNGRILASFAIYRESMGETSAANPVLDNVASRLAAIAIESHRARAARLRAEGARQAPRMQALGHLASGIAHDFGNVLQMVSSALSLIDRRAEDAAAVRRLVGMAGDAVTRGSAVTDRLLLFARKNAFSAAPIDAAVLLARMRPILAGTLGSRIAVHAHAEAGTPPLLADTAELETVLINLALNARDAMPEGGTLTLSARAETIVGPQDHPLLLPAGDYIRLAMTDTGCGMDEAVLARAAEPFFTTKPEGRGTGLGLAMARNFAEQSGGGLEISSAPWQGTTVALWLPRTA